MVLYKKCFKFWETGDTDFPKSVIFTSTNVVEYCFLFLQWIVFQTFIAVDFSQRAGAATENRASAQT